MFKKLMLLTIAATTILTPAVSASPNVDRLFPADRAVVLAEDLLEATRQMRHDVEKGRHGRQRRSGELVFALDRLQQQARSFRTDLVRGASPRRLDRQFGRTLAAFDRAERQVRFVRSGRLQRDFDRIDRVMRALQRNAQIAAAPRRHRGGDGMRGAIVLGNRRGHSRFDVRIRF